MGAGALHLAKKQWQTGGEGAYHVFTFGRCSVEDIQGKRSDRRREQEGEGERGKGPMASKSAKAVLYSSFNQQRTQLLVLASCTRVG